jgi:L-lactate dehydrogenase complex protein LldG
MRTFSPEEHSVTVATCSSLQQLELRYRMSATFELFRTRAEAVSAEVHRFDGTAEALAFVSDFLRNEGISDTPGSFAVWAPCALLSETDKLPLAAKLPGLHFTVTREFAAGAKVGLSQMDWGIANTGTLVQDAEPVAQRLVSTLPPIHVAFVATRAIVPDMPALLTKVHPSQTAYISMITGPSRTADIERVLTIGVHGPERLVIVVIDDLAEKK